MKRNTEIEENHCVSFVDKVVLFGIFLENVLIYNTSLKHYGSNSVLVLNLIKP